MTCRIALSVRFSTEGLQLARQSVAMAAMIEKKWLIRMSVMVFLWLFFFCPTKLQLFSQ